MIPDQCSGLMSVKKIMIDSLSLNGLHTNTAATVLYEHLHEVDSKKMVQQMENNLQMLESNMDNVLKTAEMLGAAHQEARVSNAVELMSGHVERRHAIESEEMLEVRKLLHRRKG